MRHGQRTGTLPHRIRRPSAAAAVRNGRCFANGGPVAPQTCYYRLSGELMNRIDALAVAALLLAACHHAPRSVYGQPLPDPHDTRALAAIGKGLKQQDLSAWTSIVATMTSHPDTPLRSRTVGEAIARWQEQRSCLDVHAKGQELAGADLKARNHEIDAFSDCLDLEL